MTTEELLQPRYKVIADYPGNVAYVGEIYEDDICIRWNEQKFKKYPHLFRKLEWWEERDEKDMPEYVKCEFEGNVTVYKIVYWNLKENRGYITEREVVSLGFLKPEYEPKPATKEEYEKQHQAT